MRGHTRKILHKHLSNDVADATIYTSGGQLYSVHFMAINEDGTVAREHWRSFYGPNARHKAELHADVQLRIAEYEQE